MAEINILVSQRTHNKRTKMWQSNDVRLAQLGGNHASANAIPFQTPVQKGHKKLRLLSTFDKRDIRRSFRYGLLDLRSILELLTGNEELLAELGHSDGLLDPLF